MEGSESVSIQAPMVGKVSIGRSRERRLQTLAMFSCSLYFIMPTTFLCWIFCISCFFHPFTAAPVACYLGYVFLLDTSPTTGSRRPFLRSFRSWWNHACDYLPVLLVKTSSFDPKKKYVLGYHPHGIISVGAFCAFATDGARTLSLEGAPDKKTASCGDRGFSSLYPGIDRRVLTLPQNFTTPLLREYFLSMGACNSARETFRNVLSKDGTAIIVVVGAAESMIVRPGTIDLVLEKRRGFVREAILANASLVPVIGFGESNLYQVYETDETTWIARLQRFVKRTTGMGMPIFQGRSIFLKDFGVMAKRTPVVVVVGAPIAPPDFLSQEQRTAFKPIIDRETDKPLNKDGQVLIEWHAKYIKALQELHSAHKNAKWNIPGQNRRTSLKIVK